MAAPTIEIRAQVRVDKTITLRAKIRGQVSSVTVELPVQAIPNGAVAVPPQPAVLNLAGEVDHTFTALPYGDYGAAIIRATNDQGETAVAYGYAMRLYVPGQAPIGTPRALLPVYTTPVFNAPSAPIGQKIVDFWLESDSPINETNVPFTFGQSFKQGELAPNSFILGRLEDNSTIPLQLNTKATWNDGSIRHAVVSGKLPALATGQTKKVSIERSAVGVSTQPSGSAALTANGFSTNLLITVDGVDYICSSNASLNSGGSHVMNWLSGGLVNEYIITLPLMKVNTTEAHPHLTAIISVRRYTDTNKCRVDLTVEHVKAYAAATDITYSGKMYIAGVEVFNITKHDGTPLVHFPCARWHHVAWWNNTNPVHIKHDWIYLCDTYMLPKYDPRIVVSESVLNGYMTSMQDKTKYSLMCTGPIKRHMPGPGGRQDLGLAPGWYVNYLTSQDKRAKKMMLFIGDSSGTWVIHRRDDISSSPGIGYPISVNNFPRCTEAALTDSKNAMTGQYEKFPVMTCVDKYSSSTNQGGQAPQAAHQPAMAYIPYLVTGDWFYLEELQFWASWNVHSFNPGSAYRAAEKALVLHDEVRGQAWSMRTAAQVAAITPDNHPLKSTFRIFYQNNLSELNKMYTDNASANKLGVATEKTNKAVIYTLSLNKVLGQGGSETYDARMADTGVGLYQDDFFTQAIGHGAELGFIDAVRLLRWKAKFPIQRMTDPGCCWWRAAYPQSFAVRPSATSPFFETLKEAWDFTHSVASRTTPPLTQAYLDLMNYEMERPATDLVLNQMSGHTGTESYSANMQPALAMAVDAGILPTESALAWERFYTRAKQPNYGEAGQFGIVSRNTMLSVPDEPPPPDTDPNTPVYPPSGQLVCTYCDGTTQMAEYHNGSGGTYTEVVAYNSTECGYTPPPPPPTEEAPDDLYQGIVGNILYFGRNN